MKGTGGPIETTGNIVIGSDDEIQIDFLIIIHLVREETEVGV
jgi:hypothetical protein